VDLNEALIRLENVAFAYESGPPVLDDLDFTFRRGQRAALVGPNGFRQNHAVSSQSWAWSGLSGRNEILGRERISEADFREVRPRIGFVFQDADDQLFLYHRGRRRGCRAPESGLEPTSGPGRRFGRPWIFWPGRFSRTGSPTTVRRGKKARLLRATVASMKPDMLLLDEPTSGLDESTTERIIEVLNALPCPA
jgi:cobalt/nickel transport system ATP-binding protein